MALGVSEWLISWDFQGCWQVVSTTGCTSSNMEIEAMAPHKSVLGPLLFFVRTSDPLVEKDFRNMKDQFHSNKVAVNVEKYLAFALGLKFKNVSTVDEQSCINNQYKQSCKHSEKHLSNRLRFSEHVDET